MQYLPYDIWQHITTFLHSEEVKSLLHINSPLFNIAMNERYRTVCIGSLTDADTEKNLRILVDPQVATRVRTLIFKPSNELVKLSSSHNKLHDTPTTLPAKARRIPQKVRSRMDMPTADFLHSNKMSAEEVADSLAKIMSQLTMLNSLQIEAYGTAHWPLSQNPKPISDLFSVGWSAFRNSLRTLDLNIPIEVLSFFLPNGIIENLEKFSVQIIRATIGTSVEQLLLDVVHPFLQGHRHSLRSLKLVSAERISLSPLLCELSLPKLSHLRLCFNEGEDDVAGVNGLHDFFKRNRAHLSSLEIEIYRSSAYSSSAGGPSNTFAQKCFLLPLKYIERLYINYTFPDVDGEHSDSLIRYIHQFKPSLRSLTLHPIPLRLSTVKKFTEGFTPASLLKSLDLTVWKFDSELLTALATNLPGLETLTLRFQIISPIIQNIPFSPYGFKLLFAEEIDQVLLSQWRLQTVNIYARETISVPWHLQPSKCREALLEALPNVKTFCGMNREEYSAATLFVEVRDCSYR